MTNPPSEDQTPPPSSRVLTSEGKMEAQAYVTAELRDTTRPTLEMDRVQYIDPRKQITVKTVRPPAAKEPPPAPTAPDLDDEMGVRPTLLRDDGSERPTIPRDDGADHPTIPLLEKPQPIAAAPAPRRSGLLAAIAAVALLALGGAWLARTPRREPAPVTMGGEPPQPVTVKEITLPGEQPAPPADKTPTPVNPPPAADTAEARAAEAPRAPLPSARPIAPRPTAAAKPGPAAPAPAPPPAPPPPAKGRLFGVDN